jgi:hypothetical protein
MIVCMGKGGGFLELGAPGFSWWAKLVRGCGGLGREARAGFFAPNGDEQAHLHTALLHGLRNRSAGEAVEMVLGLSHWN